MTIREAIREALRQEMRRDAYVFILGEDVGVYGGAFGVTDGLLAEFGPERVRDTPISEAAIVGAAAGAALVGTKPVAEIMFMDFVSIAMDQLVNQAAKIHFMFGGKATVPMVLRTPAGSGTGAAGQHSQSLEAWLVHVSGLKVVAPSTPYDAKGLLTAAIRDPNPVVFVEHKLLYNLAGDVPEDDYVIPLGSADIKRPGDNVTIVATSLMVQRSLAAADQLAEMGISAEIIDPRTLKPLDTATIIESVKRTHHLLVVIEAPQTGGFGAEVAAAIGQSEAFDYLDAPISRLCGLDVPIPYNKNLERRVAPQIEDIIEATAKLVGRTK